MGGPIKTIFIGVLVFVIGIILLVTIVLPQMHTGYTYINGTMTEMVGGSSIWGVLELIATIAMSMGGLGFIGFGLFNEAKSRKSRRTNRY